MKTKIRVLISVLLVSVLLFSALSVVVNAQKAESQTIFADELFDLLFQGKIPLTDEERAYLRSGETLSVTYSMDDVNESDVVIVNPEYTGLLQITAKEVKKTLENGIEVIWTPKSVCANGESETNLEEKNNYYSYTYDKQWHSGDVTVTVQYTMSILVPETVLNRILTADIDAVVAKRAKIISDFNQAKNDYDKYQNDLSNYQTAHAQWVIDKQAYDDYLTQKEAYDQSVADYNDLAAQWQTYNDYQTALEEYGTKSQQYTSYKATMDKVDACLAIMESMFSVAEEGEYSFYQSLAGKSDDAILNDLTVLTQFGVVSADIEDAKEEIDAIKSILSSYQEKLSASYETDFAKKETLFQEYTNSYSNLRKSFKNLDNYLNDIYGKDGVQQGIESDYSDSAFHFAQFLTQLTNYKGQLVAEQADPNKITFPESYLEEPTAPTVVTQPEEQLPETNPADEPAPTAVKNPGAEPTEPPSVANPGESVDFSQLSPEETALLAKYDANELPDRSGEKKSEPQTHQFGETVTKSIVQTVEYKNKRTVTFLNERGDQKGETLVLEYGEEITVTPPELLQSDLKSNTIAKTYEFDGWCLTTNKSKLFSFKTPITSNIKLAPHYIETLIEYTVTWEVDDRIIRQEKIAYGELPPKPQTPTRKDDGTGNFIYLFDGWSPDVKAVEGDVTYVATWRASPRTCKITWQLWKGESSTISVNNGDIPVYQNGATPQRPSDENYSYEFLQWSPKIEAATKDIIYTAVWKATSLNPQSETYTITWDFDNGADPVQEQLVAGTVPEYSGIPTKPSSAQYSYEFDGWTPEPVAVTGNATYKAKWKTTLREYTITWDLGYEGGTPKTETLKYGDPLNYGETPTRPAEGDTVYTFIGWNPAPGATVTGAATYTAQWTTNATLYTITWNVDGKETHVQYYGGVTPIYDGTPTKEQDAQYTYEFDGWDKEIVPADGDVTYTAQWKTTLREYTITWVVDGKETTVQVAYGKDPNYRGTPTKASTASNVYEFNGWSPALAKVEGDATYTAQWTKTPREYTITWDLDNGTEPITSQVAYGKIPTFPEEFPLVKAPDEQYSYEFDKWEPELKAVTRNETYTAKWKTGPRSFEITWNLGYGEPATSTAEVMSGETPVPPEGATARPDDEHYRYTFVGWSPEIAPANAAVTYTAVWEKVPLVTDVEGNTYPTQIDGETVVVDAAQSQLGLKNVIDFAAEENKTITIKRENTEFILQAKMFKEQLPGVNGIRWVEDTENGGFRVELINSDGNAMETKLTYQVTIPTVDDNRKLSIYELDGEGMTEIKYYIMESIPNRLTYTAQVGKTVVCKIRYKLVIEGTYFSNLPDFAEPGETISLAAVRCETGFEVIGATLIHEDGTEEKIGTSFTMPAEFVTVRLQVNPIQYHIVFKCNDQVISDKSYDYGENIEVPADPTLPDEEGYKFEFVGWIPQVSQTVAGDAREQVYEAKFVKVPNAPQVEEKTGFIDSPAFAVLIMALIVGAVTAVAVVAVVVRMKKKSDDN